jgi:hypothetical protein
MVKHDTPQLADAGGIDPAVLRSIYLLIRLNMPALLAEGRESIPLLIEAPLRDENFSRSAYINHVLESVAGQQQVLVFAGDEKAADSLQQKTGMRRGKKLSEKV